MKKIILYLKIISVVIFFWMINKNEEHYKIAEKDNRFGIIDIEKRVKIDFLYKNILKSEDKYILVSERKIEVLEKNLNKIFECKVDEVIYLKNEKIVIKEGEKYYFLKKGALFEIDSFDKIGV